MGPVRADPPRDLSELKDMIAKREVRVPSKLRSVLQYILENPSDVAFI